MRVMQKDKKKEIFKVKYDTKNELGLFLFHKNFLKYFVLK